MAGSERPRGEAESEKGTLVWRMPLSRTGNVGEVYLVAAALPVATAGSLAPSAGAGAGATSCVRAAAE